MRHLRRNLIIAILATAAAASLFGVYLASGRRPQAILAGIVTSVAAFSIFALTRRPLQAIDIFAAGLEANETSTFIPQSDDPALRHTAEILNRLARAKAASALGLETRKLYYDRILRVITHEMRNSIAPIISLSDDISARPDCYASSSALAEAAAIISNESHSIKRFLDSYYELTHLPPPSPSTFDGAEMLRNLWLAVSSRARELGVSPEAIKINAAAGLTLTADRDLILRALTNLLRNALDAASPLPHPEITITATLSEDGGAYLVVADNGPGLPPAVAENLFQPFLTTKPGGSGVGLCLARQIARLHGGDIKLIPSASGATFAMTIPAG